MENASKALLISGGILIAMLVMGIGVYLFGNYKSLEYDYNKKMEESEIQKVNANFTKFIGRTDITIHEIVSLASFAREYNEKNGTEINVFAINSISNQSFTWKNADGAYYVDLTKAVKEDDGDKYVFVGIVPYDTANYEGLVWQIRFIKN